MHNGDRVLVVARVRRVLGRAHGLRRVEVELVQLQAHKLSLRANAHHQARAVGRDEGLEAVVGVERVELTLLLGKGGLHIASQLDPAVNA